MRGGYIIIRSGITDHLLASRLGFFELGIYATIHLQADFRSGLWWGSAPRLLATAPSGTNLRQVQKALQSLASIGFLRPFHIQGARGNYPVLIDKYDIRTGALRGMRLNAAQSVSWRSPFYEVGAEGDAEADAEQGTELAPSQYSVSNMQDSKTRSHSKRTSTPPEEIEQRRKIEARNRREQIEVSHEKNQRAAESHLHVGEGPSAAVFGVRPKAAVLERNRRREAANG